MKKLLFLFSFLPLLLLAEVPPCPLSMPVVYDLTGAIDRGYSVVAVVTDQAEMSEFSFDSETNYITLLTNALFYYALCLDSAGHQQFLYMGPQEVGGDVVIQELQPLPSSLGEGAKAAGKGALISLGAGTGIFVFALAADTGDGWTALLGLFIGVAVAYVGIIASVAWGIIKGVQVSERNRTEKVHRERRARNSSSSTTFIVTPVDREIVPVEYVEKLDPTV